MNNNPSQAVKQPQSADSGKSVLTVRESLEGDMKAIERLIETLTKKYYEEAALETPHQEMVKYLLRRTDDLYEEWLSLHGLVSKMPRVIDLSWREGEAQVARAGLSEKS